MDPYFSPILLSSLIVILLNTFLALPIPGFPMLTYFIGGVIAVVFFRNNKLKESANANQETKVFDASVLGIAVGIVVGSILTFIVALKLQDPELKQAIIDRINEQMKMSSNIEFNFIDDLNPSFYFILGLTSIFFTTLISFFGSLTTLPFLNKPKK